MMTLCGYFASAGVENLRSFPIRKSFHLGSGIPYGWGKNEYFGLWVSILLEVQVLLLKSAVPYQIMV